MAEREAKADMEEDRDQEEKEHRWQRPGKSYHDLGALSSYGAPSSSCLWNWA